MPVPPLTAIVTFSDCAVVMLVVDGVTVTVGVTKAEVVPPRVLAEPVVPPEPGVPPSLLDPPHAAKVALNST